MFIKGFDAVTRRSLGEKWFKLEGHLHSDKLLRTKVDSYGLPVIAIKRSALFVNLKDGGSPPSFAS
jgi:hypothetical protein